MHNLISLQLNHRSQHKAWYPEMLMADSRTHDCAEGQAPSSASLDMITGCRATHAGRPLLLRVNLMSAARRRSSRGPMSSRPRQKCRSLPPCSGRPSVGSGDGSSIRWIISAT